jgi:hypothetical protein
MFYLVKVSPISRVMHFVSIVQISSVKPTQYAENVRFAIGEGQ